jgi:hypothetical protein
MAHFSVKSHTARTILKRPEPKPLRISTHEEIAHLAYSYWEARGGQTGSAETDWLRAEKVLNGRFTEDL